MWVERLLAVESDIDHPSWVGEGPWPPPSASSAWSSTTNTFISPSRHHLRGWGTNQHCGWNKHAASGVTEL